MEQRVQAMQKTMHHTFIQKFEEDMETQVQVPDLMRDCQNKCAVFPVCHSYSRY